jgi:hypothetical protein
MVTDTRIQAIDLYRILMFEARQRIEAINLILAGGAKLAEGILRELCYLQLRMLCENIALGCLVAHGDVVDPQINNFEKEWSGEKILGKLQKLNPYFFPQQVDFGIEDSVASNDNALTKSELLRLYAISGSVLHRGSLKKKNLTYGKMNVRDVVNWTKKIEDLLGSHLIPLHATTESAIMIICSLRNPTQNMDTTVHWFETGKRKMSFPSILPPSPGET